MNKWNSYCRWIKKVAVGSTAFISCVAVLCMFLGANVPPALSEKTTYAIFCVSGRIEIDSRTLPQMKQARGSDICEFGRFDYRSDAESFARKQFKGEGAMCACK